MTKYQGLQKFAYMLLFFPLLNPSGLVYIMPSAAAVFRILRFVSYLGILLLFICSRKKIDSFLILTLLYLGSLLLSTILNDGIIMDCIKQMCGLVAFALIIKLLIDHGTLFCMDVLMPPIEILIYLNLLTILIYPKGMTTVTLVHWTTSNIWLLGMDNSQMPYYVFAITVAVLRSYCLYNQARLSARSLCLVLACMVTVAIRWQATIVVGLFIICLFLLFPGIFEKIHLLNIRTYICIVGVFFAVFVIFQLQESFAFVIENILKKSISFTGRTTIWKNALNTIVQQPWLGYGVQSYGFAWGHLGHLHAHNKYLNVLYEGGILQMTFFLGIHVLAAKMLLKNRSELISGFLSIVLFSLMIMFQSERYGISLYFTVFQFAYYSDNIIRELKEQDITYKSRRHRTVFRWGPRRAISTGNGR